MLHWNQQTDPPPWFTGSVTCPSIVICGPELKVLSSLLLFSLLSIWWPITRSQPQTVWPALCILGRWGLLASRRSRSPPLCWLQSTADSWVDNEAAYRQTNVGLSWTKSITLFVVCATDRLQWRVDVCFHCVTRGFRDFRNKRNCQNWYYFSSSMCCESVYDLIVSPKGFK